MSALAPAKSKANLVSSSQLMPSPLSIIALGLVLEIGEPLFITAAHMIKIDI